VPGQLPIEWRVNNFDLLRLLAALQVALVHAITFLKPTGYFVHLLASGLERFPGLPIFFVVSGLLISTSYERSDSLREYLRNRCLRIFPGLWVCLAVSVAAILALGVGSLGPVTATHWLLWWAAQMSFFQSYQADFFKTLSTGALNGSQWTIPIELEFYVLLPALYRILQLRSRRGHVPLLAIALGSLSVQLLLPQAYCFLRLTVAPYLWMFLVGVAIQRNWRAVRAWLVGRAHWWGLGYVLLCAAARWLRVEVGGNDISPVYLLPLAGLIVSLAMSAPELSDRLLRHQDVSYGLYIYHMLVIDLMLGLAVASGWVALGAAVVASLGVAAVSWTLIEKPFLRRKRGALRAVSGGSSGAAISAN